MASRIHGRFMCDYEGCGRTFTKKFNLQTHLRVHSGETPFVCEVKGCDRKFRWQSSLVSHIQTHSRPTATAGKKGPVRAAKSTEVENTASMSELTWADSASLLEALTPRPTTSEEPLKPCISEENSLSVPSVAHQLDMAQLPLHNLCELWDLYQFPEVPKSAASTVSLEQNDGDEDYWNLALDRAMDTQDELDRAMDTQDELDRAMDSQDATREHPDYEIQIF